MPTSIWKMTLKFPQGYGGWFFPVERPLKRVQPFTGNVAKNGVGGMMVDHAGAAGSAVQPRNAAGEAHFAEYTPKHTAGMAVIEVCKKDQEPFSGTLTGK
jgi:hypothetical protein